MYTYLVSISRVLKDGLNGSWVCFLLFTNTKHVHVYNTSSLHRNQSRYKIRLLANLQDSSYFEFLGTQS